MRKNYMIAAMFAMFAMGISVAAQKAPDFSGKWMLDVGKSKLGERNTIESQTMTVTQTASEIKIETATKRAAPQGGGGFGGGGRGGAARGGGGFGGGDTTMIYSLDGKETKISQESPAGSIPVTLKAKIDGGKLNISQTRTINSPMGEQSITTKDKWSLSEDGSTLTVERSQASMRGDLSSTMVFIKKQ